MTINPYDKGSLVRLDGPFRDFDTGDPVDPADVFISYKNPAGTITTLQYGVDPAVQRLAPGDYRIEIDVTMSGMWHWRWFATGIGQASDEGQFYVRPSYT